MNIQALPTSSDVFNAVQRVARLTRETPVLTHSALDEASGAQVFVKAECLQVTGSFKIRGATNRLAQIPAAGRKAGVVAFSSGNHAQGVAHAARHFGMPALIVMPSDAPRIKIAGVIADGAEIHLYDRNTESRETIAAEIAHQRGAILVPSFDNPHIIAGQGTLGLEFARQVEAAGSSLDHLICCTGGGGLITGIALGLEKASPHTRIWTAEPQHHDDWARSLAAGTILSNAPGTHSFCDAIVTREPGEMTFALGRTRLAGGFAVTDDEVKTAMRFAFERMKIVVEPGGAVALAVALKGLPPALQGCQVGIVVSGGNVDPALFASVLV